jgi:hypothetical protein
MAKKLTSSKAKQILHDKSVHGHPLTDKQRKFFGAIAGGAKPYKAESGGWLDEFDTPQAQNGIEGTMAGLTDKGFNYNGAWGGPSMAMGGSLPGSVGFTYARTGSTPSEGPYAKKTMPSAQNGMEMSYYQNGLDWKPRNISENGSEIPKAQVGERFAPPARESTAIRMFDPLSGKQFSTATTGITPKQMEETSRSMGRVKKAEREEVKKRVAERKAAKATVDKGKPFTFPTGETKKLEDMNWREKAYVSGQAVQQRGRINEDDEAWYDVLNPVSWLTDIAGGLGTAPYEAQQSNSNLPYLSAIANPLIQGALGFDPLGSAMKVPAVADRYLTSVGRSLAEIEKQGLREGLSSHDIAKRQMKEVGITSNQRQGYVPGLSDLAERYITPYGYSGMGGKNKIQQTIDNILKGGIKDRKMNFNKDISSPFVRNEISPERSDAWRLYLGKPQQYNTFRIAETAPLNHPSYTPNQLANMDIYSINSEYGKVGIKPNTEFPELMSPLRIEDNMELLRNKINIDRGNEIMGGYNKRLNQHGLEYNDIWDLQPHVVPRDYLPGALLKNTLGESSLFIKTLPNGVQVPRSFKIDASRFLGKPFMSHEVLPYTSNNLTREMNDIFDYQIQKLRESPYDMTPKIQKMEAYKEELKNYPKQKKGGVIKDDMGQWAHPGEITEIGSNRITMQGVPYPVLGVSDTGDTKMMFPGEDYKFKGKKVTEIPMAQWGCTGRSCTMTGSDVDKGTRSSNFLVTGGGGDLYQGGEPMSAKEREKMGRETMDYKYPKKIKKQYKKDLQSQFPGVTEEDIYRAAGDSSILASKFENAKYYLEAIKKHDEIIKKGGEKNAALRELPYSDYGTAYYLQNLPVNPITGVPNKPTISQIFGMYASPEEYREVAEKNYPRPIKKNGGWLDEL